MRSFHYIPQEDNQLADALATLSSMFKISHDRDIPLIKVQTREQLAYCHTVEGTCHLLFK